MTSNIAITSISVSVTAKMGANYEYDSDFISWTATPANKQPWTIDQAALASLELSKQISDLILTVACAKNKISVDTLRDRRADLKTSFETFLEAKTIAIEKGKNSQEKI